MVMCKLPKIGIPQSSIRNRHSSGAVALGGGITATRVGRLTTSCPLDKRSRSNYPIQGMNGL